MPGLDEWLDTEARYATEAMLRAVSATHLVMDRPGFGQRVIPRPGSVLASPVVAHYDPDPDYFFHWYRDSALVIDALRVALTMGYADSSTVERLREFVWFSHSLLSLDGQTFLRRGGFRAVVQPAFREYLRPDAEIAALCGQAVLADARVNADGTLDFTRWGRPQTDGPALRALALLRWRRKLADLHEDPPLESALAEVVSADLAFTLARAQQPSNDIWEEESGYHYYTQLVQAQALLEGGAWLEESAQVERAEACRRAAAEVLSRLDRFWSDAQGFYRSRIETGSASAAKDLDIAVVLAVLHAARRGGPHSVLDPKAQATLAALEQLFDGAYAINRERPPGRGPALGRYANDRYYSGGAWYLATLAAAEFYFRLAQALSRGESLAMTAENLSFRERLGSAAATASSEGLARLAIERGDAIMRTVRAFTPPSGALSEQFDQTTGEQTSAKQLSWSYAAFVTAAVQRAKACRPIQAADLATDPAGRA